MLRTPGEILSELSRELGRSIPDIARKSGYGRPQAFYDVMSGKTMHITPKMADNIVRAFPQVNRNTLICGEGELFKTAKGSQHSFESSAYSGFDGSQHVFSDCDAYSNYDVSQRGLFCSDCDSSQPELPDSNGPCSDGSQHRFSGFHCDAYSNYDASDSSQPEQNAARSVEAGRYSPVYSIHHVPIVPISAQGGPLNDFVVSVNGADCEKIVSPISGVDFAITVDGDSMAPEFPCGSQVLVKKINALAFIEWGKTYVLDTCNGTVIKKLAPSTSEGCVRCLSVNPSPEFAPFDICMEDVYGFYRVIMCMSLK